VADNGTVDGWAKPERLDLQSHSGSVIGAQVDPLPPFVADMRAVDGKPITVIRVFASADVPHIAWDRRRVRAQLQGQRAGR
jgi:hypothetical protein